MQYPYSLPSQYSADALHALVAGKNLPGFQGLAVEGSTLLALFAVSLSGADKATLDAAIAGYAYVAPAPTPNWVGLLDWAAMNVPEDDLWALQSSKYGSFMNTAAMTGNWGAPDGSTTGAASWYVKLKADVAANPSKYTATTGDTLTKVAAQFSAFGVPITP